MVRHPKKLPDLYLLFFAEFSLHELVKNGKNGLVFENAAQLADQLEMLLASFPNSTSLGELRSSLITHKDWEWNTWEENWGKVVRPLILSDVNEFPAVWKQ